MKTFTLFCFLEFTYDLDIVIVVQEKILNFQVSELRSRNQYLFNVTS